jgi:hypothetical protein
MRYADLGPIGDWWGGGPTKTEFVESANFLQKHTFVKFFCKFCKVLHFTLWEVRIYPHFIRTLNENNSHLNTNYQ